MRGGVARRGGSTNRPSPGGSSSRPMVARPVRYGPVRQKKTFLYYTRNQGISWSETRSDSGIGAGSLGLGPMKRGAASETRKLGIWNLCVPPDRTQEGA